jgi:hypothetical protein
MIERSQIVGVEDVKIKHRHHARVDTVEKHVVGIGCSRVDFFQLVHTREAGWSELLVKIRIGDVAIDNMDIANDGMVCGYRSGVHRGCACSVASEHGIVVRYGLGNR